VATLKAALENAASSFGGNDRRSQNWQLPCFKINDCADRMVVVEYQWKTKHRMRNNDAKKEGHFYD